MVMITGGAYQGKIAYVMRNLGVAESDITDGSVCELKELKNARCIRNYHELVKRIGEDCIDFTKELCRDNPDCIIIIDEIGCGIIPLEKCERVWRENVGRCGCIIASASETVVRVVCGVPSVIKDVTS